MVALAYSVSGADDAPVIVLSGSIGSSRAMWDAITPALATAFRVIAVDHRGHGDSPVPDGPYEMDDLADDVIELMDALGIERAHFAGLSMGGMVGMSLAARYPERVDHLVLACTSAYLPPAQVWIDRAAAVRESGMAPLADATMQRWFTDAFRAAHDEIVDPVRQAFIDTPAEGYARCGLAISRMDQRDRLVSITAPTLVISGEVDPTTSPAVCEELRAALADARHVTLPTAHLASVEDPVGFANAVLAHLS